MDEAELLAYLRSRFPRETESCEWKEFKHLKHAVSGKAGEDLISYAAAMANMEGGSILVGVTDSFGIVGILDFHDYDASNLRARVVGKCLNLSSDGLEVESHTASDSGKTVWVVHVPKHRPRLPVYAHGKAWQRLEDRLVEIRPERMASILGEPMNGSDWTAEIVQGATLNDLDPSAVFAARAKFKERSRSAPYFQEIDGWDDSTFLNKAKITIGGGVTRAALILLGRPESIHLIPGPVQITWKLEGVESAYEHFGPPFLLNTSLVLKQIRNYTFKIFPQNQLLATEVDKYDTRVILEALHNCLAHQDFAQGARILVREKVDRLVFENAGSFFDGNPEDYFAGERTPKRYRNPWLANAMVNLGMIDTVGHGIHTMILAQRKRYFPLPDYSQSKLSEVVLEVFGHTLDENYSRLLLENRDLPLGTVILLDRVQKRQAISDEAATLLRRNGFLEGRKPNYYVAAHIAKATGRRSEYIRNRAFDDAHYKDMILAFLDRFGSATKSDIEKLVLDKLSDALDAEQRRNKLRNLLFAMAKRDQTIEKIGGRQKGRWVRVRG